MPESRHRVWVVEDSPLEAALAARVLAPEIDVVPGSTQSARMTSGISRVVMIVTSREGREVRLEALEARVNDIVQKPFDPGTTFTVRLPRSVEAAAGSEARPLA